jgi:diguanylate cyclase (GGDEF)-like protein
VSAKPVVLLARALGWEAPDARGRLAAAASNGVEVILFESQEEGIRLLSGRQVDLVLLRTDARGEHRNLLALAAQSLPRVPVIAVLPPGTVEPADRFAAFDEVLAEPLEPGRLARAARNALRVRALSQQLHEKDLELQTLDEVGRTIISSLELQTVLNIIMEKTRELVHAESWSLLLGEEGEGGLSLSVAVGEGAGRSGAAAVLKPGEGIAGWVAREGKPVVVHDAAADPRWSDTELAYGTRARSILCVPLESRGRVLGVIQVVNKKGGADGFSTRDLNLVTRLAGFAAIAIENARLYQQTKQLTLTDELTRLYNTRFFTQYLDAEVKRCRRYKSSVALIFLDLDHFKLVNDRHGHLVGSQLLREVADVLRHGVRDVDIVARYGGDEFIVILPETALEAASLVAERLRQAMDEHVFLVGEGLRAHLTASFGVAAFPETCASENELIRLADQAMYRVKNLTRNGVYIAAADAAGVCEGQEP